MRPNRCSRLRNKSHLRVHTEWLQWPQEEKMGNEKMNLSEGNYSNGIPGVNSRGWIFKENTKTKNIQMVGKGEGITMEKKEWMKGMPTIKKTNGKAWNQCDKHEHSSKTNNRGWSGGFVMLVVYDRSLNATWLSEKRKSVCIHSHPYTNNHAMELGRAARGRKKSK